MSFIDLANEAFNSEGAAKKIENKLQQKYGMNFEVIKIGGRYGSANFDNVTAYCCPSEKRHKIFTATLNVESDTIDDDYALRHVTSELAHQIERIFFYQGIEAIVKIDVIGVNRLSKIYSIIDFIKLFPNSNFIANVVLRGKIDREKLGTVYGLIVKAYPSIYIKTIVQEIVDRNFDNIKELANSVPVLYTSVIKQYKVLDEIKIKIQSNDIEFIED